MHPKVEAARTSEELTRLTAVTVTAFRLSALYGTIGDDEGGRLRKDRLELGCDAGRRYLEALSEGAIEPRHRYGGVPALSFVSGHVSIDFSLGRTFEKAFADAGKMVMQNDGRDVPRGERDARCRQKIDQLENELASLLA